MVDVDVAGVVTAAGGVIALVLKVVLARPRRQRAADVESRLEALESQLLGWASWAHDARVTAASHGVRLPAIPAQLLGGATVPDPDLADTSG